MAQLVKEKFDELIARIKPLLKESGFSKSGLSFYKNAGALIYVLNFQKSSGNTADKTRFYINCGIYAPAIDAAQGRETLAKPKEYECHFRDRISSLARCEVAFYEIAENTDVTELEAILAGELKAAIEFFDRIKTERVLIGLMLKRSGLFVIDQLFEYLLIKGEDEALTRSALKLFAEYGGEARWMIFERRINGLLKKHGRKELNFKDEVR